MSITSTVLFDNEDSRFSFKDCIISIDAPVPIHSVVLPLQRCSFVEPWLSVVVVPIQNTWYQESCGRPGVILGYWRVGGFHVGGDCEH